MGVAKWGGEPVGTTEEAGRMHIGIPRTHQLGKDQSQQVVQAVGVRNTRSGLASTREWRAQAVARIVQGA